MAIWLYCVKHGYSHPNCKCYDEMPNVPSSAASAGNGGGGGAGTDHPFVAKSKGGGKAEFFSAPEGDQAGGVLSFAEGGEVPPPEPENPVQEILKGDPSNIGSSVEAANALGKPITEGLLGDPGINGEHVVGHMGLKDLLDGKLSENIVKASDKMEEPTAAGIAGLGHVEKIVNKHADNLDNRVENIFSGKMEPPEMSEAKPEEHKATVERLNTLANNPSGLIDEISKATAPLYAVAPKIAQSAQETAARAVQFLSSKASQPDSGPLDDKYAPSPSEMAAFHRYLSVVENPQLALHQIKEGTLTPETVETMQTVYPRLYDKMKQGIIENLNPDMPYRTKVALSEFMGAPLDLSMTPIRLQSMQNSYVQEQQQKAANAAPKGKSSVSGLSKITLAQRTSLATSDNE